MVLALSLSSDVKSIGAYAGFAAIVGLALLVILYFAQARETRRLSDALDEHEARLRRIPPPTAATVARPVVAVGAATPLAQPHPVPVPATAVTASPPTATVAVPGARRVAVTPAATVVAVPAAPASEAADAATDVRPAQTQAAAAPVSAPAEPAEDEAAPPDPAPTAKPPEPPAQQTQTPPPPVDPAPSPSILPAATAAGAAAAAAKPDAPDEDEGEATTTVRPAAMPLVARPAATAEAPSPAPAKQAPVENAAPVAALADPPPPRYPPAPGERAAPVGATARISGRGDGATATLRRERRPDAEREGDGEGHHLGSRGTLRLLAVAIVLVGVLIFVANQLLSSGSPSHPPATGPQTSSGPAPATVTVAVLNGTPSSGLASRVSSTLVSDGFKPGAINNAPSHHLAKTTVQYIHSSDLAAANEVAHDLQLTTTQVTRADAATIAAATIAGRVPTIIAVIGTNYAQ